MEVAETATKILIPDLSRLCKDSRNAGGFLALEIPRCSMPRRLSVCSIRATCLLKQVSPSDLHQRSYRG